MQIEAQTLTLDRAELRAILTTASTDCARVNLHGVLVDPARCVLVSTDGHRMTVATAGGARFANAAAVVLPRDLLDVLAKAASAKDTIVLAWEDPAKDHPGGVPCTATYGLRDESGELGRQSTTAGHLSSAGFPPWRAVFPTALHETRVPLTMNPHYVADALLAIAKLQGKVAQVTCWGPAKGEERGGRNGCTADQSAELSPIIFAGRDHERGVDWRIVIMPIRPEKGMPDFRAVPAEPAKTDTLERDDVKPAAAANTPADDRPIGKRSRTRKAA